MNLLNLEYTRDFSLVYYKHWTIIRDIASYLRPKEKRPHKT